VKLPNPPVLTDGKDPEFEDWDSRMRNKLKANADHYNTEALRIAYVENRVGGKAAKHLRPRLRASAVNPYTTAEEMLKHLETIFQDANKEANAKREFRKLNMRATDKFQDFLTDFLHLAGEAQIPATMYKDELYQRVTWKLQEMTIKNRWTVISTSTCTLLFAQNSQTTSLSSTSLETRAGWRASQIPSPPEIQEPRCHVQKQGNAKEPRPSIQSVLLEQRHWSHYLPRNVSCSTVGSVIIAGFLGI
jgi:hypothetical protein